jgi:predicted dinucleotide-utilizing enzyme
MEVKVNIGDPEFEKKLHEWMVEQRKGKPKFDTMNESMSWAAKKRQEFIELLKEKGELK